MQNMEAGKPETELSDCEIRTSVLKYNLWQEETFLDKLVLNQYIEIFDVVKFLILPISVSGLAISFIETYWTPKVFTQVQKMEALFKAADARYDACMDRCMTCTCVRKTKPCPHNCQLNCKCEEEEDNEPVTGIIDPSGYVYEAVSSNRLSGVTVTAIYKETEESEESVWDAKAYSQANPLLTDAAGFYAWDVPEGFWRVKYEKDGYETAYSDWLPVPPPQLEVNVGIVSNAPPTVTDAYAYADGVDLTFSKYMDPDTVKEAVTVTLKTGDPVDGKVAAVKPEEGLATVFRFVPDKAFASGAQIDISVSGAESYAGIAMAEEYTGAATVRTRLTKIDAKDMSLVYGADGKLTVTAEPKAAAAGRRILIKVNTPSIASVTGAAIQSVREDGTAEAVLDANGTAELTVKTNLPGMALFTLSADEPDVRKDITVDILTFPPEGNEDPDDENGDDENGNEENGGNENTGNGNTGNENTGNNTGNNNTGGNNTGSPGNAGTGIGNVNNTAGSGGTGVFGAGGSVSQRTASAGSSGTGLFGGRIGDATNPGTNTGAADNGAQAPEVKSGADTEGIKDTETPESTGEGSSGPYTVLIILIAAVVAAAVISATVIRGRRKRQTP
jgi:hypothetical protein